MLESQLSTNISAICQLSGYLVELRSKLSINSHLTVTPHLDTYVQDQLNVSVV